MAKLLRWTLRLIKVGILGLTVSVVVLIAVAAVWRGIEQAFGLGPDRALHRAVLESSPDEVSRLLAAGADPNRAEDGISPLQLAVFERDLRHQSPSRDSAQIVERLLKAGALARAPRGRWGAPPRWLRGDSEIYARDPRPLNLALFALNDPGLASLVGVENLATTVELLLDHGATVRDDDLQRASASGNIRALRSLLKHGGNVSERDVLSAIDAGKVDVVQLLLDHGVQLSPRMLIHAAIGCEVPALTVLLQAGAPPNALDPRTNYRVEYATGPTRASFTWNPSPLEWAISFDCVEAARVLLEFGADPQMRSPSGSQPMHAAARRGNVAIARLLWLERAEPSSPDRQGRTPLHLAAQAGHAEMAVWLIEAGADPHVRDSGASSPLQVAVAAGHPNAVRGIRCATQRRDKRNSCAHRELFGSIVECLTKCEGYSPECEGVSFDTQLDAGQSIVGYARNGYFNGLLLVSDKTIESTDGLLVSDQMQLRRVLDPGGAPVGFRSVEASWTRLGIDHCVPDPILDADVPDWTILATPGMSVDIRSPTAIERERFYELETACVHQGDYLPEDQPPCVRPQPVAVSDYDGDGQLEYWHTAPFIWDTGFSVSEEAPGGLVSLAYACPGCSD